MGVFLKDMAEIQAATRAARGRTGDNTIGTQIEAGRIQVVQVIPTKKGPFDVEPISDWMPIPDVVAYLGGMN